MSKLLEKLCNTEMEDLTKKGIYKIHHIKKPNIFYIGSASGGYHGKKCKQGFYRRFLEHLRDLQHNRHDSIFMQNVVNAHGIEGLRFEIIEIVDSKERKEILKREQYYLDGLKPGYNTSRSAMCPTIEYTPERRKALSDKMKGKSLAKEVYDEMKKSVFQLTIENVFIKKYDSIREAATNTKIDHASISKVASGKRSTAGGFVWSFENPKEAREMGFLI